MTGTEPRRMSAPKMGLVILLLVGVAMYLALCVLVWSQQESLLFFPSYDLAITPKSLGMDFRQVDIKVNDEVKLYSWLIPPPPSTANPDEATWVVHCHGNGGNICGRLEVAKILHELGFGVILFDYRGYGKSTGRPHCEADLVADAEAALNTVPSLGKRVLFGESLGGGVACQLALKNPVEAIILQSTFTSLNARASDSYPFLPVAALCRYPFDSLSAVQELKIPKLILHSNDDEVTSVRHGRKLFEQAAEPKMWGELRGGHNDYQLKSLSEPLKEFSQKYLK